MSEMEFLYENLFAGVLNSNGQICAGLAASAEASVPKHLRIPVPGQSVINQVSSRSQRLRVAHWAYKKVMSACETHGSVMHSKVFATGAYLAWSTGCVALSDSRRLHAEMNVADIASLRWDAEVEVYDEAVERINDRVTGVEAKAMELSEECAAAVRTIVNYVVAAKMTWWSTGHHLGSEGIGGVRVRHGYLSKVTVAMPLTGFGFENDADRSRLYNLVHTWSTLSVMKAITGSSDIRDSLSPPVAIIDGRVTVAAPIPIAPAADVMIRFNGFGAGYAVLGDLATALKSLAPTPLMLICPGVEQIPTLLALHEEVKKNAYKWGIAAKYLTNSDNPERVDQSTFNIIKTSLITFVRATKRKTTLGRAAVFDPRMDHTALDGYSVPFDAACSAYAMELSGASSCDVERLRYVMSAIHGGVGAAPSQAVMDALGLIGVTFGRNYYSEMVAAGKEFDEKRGRKDQAGGPQPTRSASEESVQGAQQSVPPSAGTRSRAKHTGAEGRR